MLHEFKNVFPDEILGILPKEINLTFELVP